MDKEVDIRRRILKDFNKLQEDFDSLREYNDYLEMVEDIIFNLTNNIDILETNKKIQQYKEDNKDNIMKNRSRLSQDALELLDILSMEEKYSNQVSGQENNGVYKVTRNIVNIGYGSTSMSDLLTVTRCGWR